MKIKLSKSQWEFIGKKTGWITTSQFVKTFTWTDEYKGSGTWDIDYKDIEPEDLYYKDEPVKGRAKSDKDIMREMIQSITNSESGEKLSSAQIDYFINKLMATDEFFDLVKDSNKLYEQERMIEERELPYAQDMDENEPDTEKPQY